MSMSRRLAAAASLAALVLAGARLSAAPPATLGEPAARLETYAAPDGQNYFALSLAPAARRAAPAGHDVVVMVDTSASQAGPYRASQMAALRALLDNLGPQDRVALWAVDLGAVPLTAGFAPRGGDALRAALAQLEQRVPLGSTDLKLALEAAARQAADARRAKAAVYIGDGMSTARLFGSESFEQLTSLLVENRLPVSSYAVGPEIDFRLLAALANQTGGNLAVARPLVWANAEQGVSAQRAAAENDRNAAEMGAYLAASVQTAVLWPSDVTWPAALTEVYPRKMPPLRGDRDTIVIGALAADAGPMTVALTAEQRGQTRPIQWSVQPAEPSIDNAYLAELVGLARRDGGVTLATVGTPGLRESRRLIEAGVENLTDLARQAVATGNLEGAEMLAGEALRRDPGNPRAEAVKRGASAVRQNAATPDVRIDELKMVNAQADAAEPVPAPAIVPPPPADPAAAPAEESFIDRVEASNRVAAQVIQAEVETQLQQARVRMATDPAGVIQELKLLLSNIRRAPELNAEVRAQLSGRIEAALREASRREVIVEEELRIAQQTAAAAREQSRILDRLTRDEQKAKALVARMNSLILEQRYQEAEEGPGAELGALPVARDTARAAVLHARFAGYDSRNRAVDVASRKAFVDTLALVKRSSIPFPDEPPIVYPDADVWEELTLRRKKYAAVDLKGQGPAEQKIRQALEEDTNFEFVETPLKEVIEYIKQLHGIEIQIDQKALDAVGLGTDTPVTRNLKGIRLKSALRLMLDALDLRYVIRDEVLMITTPEEVENLLVTKVYPVADLVIPIPIATGMGMGGMGMMGGMGGMGMGGMGGMGMGGMGGMGGMRGGMGGGMFNVPDDPESHRPAPAQEPVLKLFDAAPAPQAKPAATKPEPKAEAIAVDPNVAPEKFWNELFAGQRLEPKRVRAAARELLEQRKFDHLIALCQGALRHGQPQPWMYESLGLAMELNGSPKEDIERALMSAADFGAGPDELLYVAQYLTRLGFDARALSIYRQVAELQPTRPEPYARALLVAQRLDDLEALQWATIGVLSQAWPADQASIAQKAFRVAQATLDRLKQEKRSEEYAGYKKRLDAALLRDCIVMVTWTGDADIDMLVEEPAGTICSLRAQRTTAGGVLQGDSASNYVEQRDGEHCEIYACPQGFAGTYRVLLRRVWGKPTAGKVTMDVYTNYGTKIAKHERRQLAVGEKDAVAVFDLEHGRRQEPLAERQVANAAARQVAVNRAVLAQQLNAIYDPRVGVLPGARRGQPFGGINLRGGAVGYQPVIIQLPEGANASFTGVISADRRYVRVSPRPVFSGIGEVTTFTFAGAASGGGNRNNAGGGAGGLGGLGGGGGLGGMGGMGGGMGGMGGMGGRGGMGGMGGGGMGMF